MDFEELTDRITFRQKKNKKNNYGESEEVKEAVGLAGPELEEQL